MDNLVTPVKKNQPIAIKKKKVHKVNRGSTPPSIDTFRLTTEGMNEDGLPVPLEDLPFPGSSANGQRRNNTMIIKGKDKLPELPKFYGDRNKSIQNSDQYTF